LFLVVVVVVVVLQRKNRSKARERRKKKIETFCRNSIKIFSHFSSIKRYT